METRRDVFQAIADPTRRGIISLVAGKTQNLNSLADNFDMSRQAISLHVKILTECGLITIRQQGRERFCEARLEALGEVSGWVNQYKQFWTDNFKSLDTYLKKVQAKKRHAKRK
jgi:DNA-binding transcriptional ArsR family regulator